MSATLSSYKACCPLHELGGAFAERLAQRINRSGGIHGFGGRVAFKDTRAQQTAIRRNNLGAEFDLGRGRSRRRQLELSQVEEELIVSRHVFRRPGNRKAGIFKTLDYFCLHELGRAVAPFGPCKGRIFVAAGPHQNFAGSNMRSDAGSATIRGLRGLSKEGKVLGAAKS